MGGKWHVYDLMQCLYTLAVVDSTDADVEFNGSVHVCIHLALCNRAICMCATSQQMQQ